MGPLPCRSGNFWGGVYSVECQMLQWGRSHAGAEIQSPVDHQAAIRSLQWGRSHAGAEIASAQSAAISTKFRDFSSSPYLRHQITTCASTPSHLRNQYTISFQEIATTRVLPGISAAQDLSNPSITIFTCQRSPNPHQKPGHHTTIASSLSGRLIFPNT